MISHAPTLALGFSYISPILLGIAACAASFGLALWGRTFAESTLESLLVIVICPVIVLAFGFWASYASFEEAQAITRLEQTLVRAETQ